ncbi:MAG: pyridoxine 5'-phosphate synthase [Alphaproteobacteria bacterium]|nr:pyridoxine 5'-phosphate synthase [Alphaproteobacteria bacterium]
MKKLRLGFNVDHVATVRNARGGAHPDPVEAAKRSLAAGVDGITAHLREDRRHIRDADMRRLKIEVPAPLNFEMAATDEMRAIALDIRPHACCLVPEKRTEVTTEGGLDVVGHSAALKPYIARLKDAGIRVSLFIDPDVAQLDAALAVGAPVVELHTGAYAHAEGTPAFASELERLRAAARHADHIGLECHAGHGLTFGNVAAVAKLPELVELNIGHFLVGAAIFDGLEATIGRMRAAMDAARA